VIFDTDVLIWALRGNEKAAQVIENDENRAVSVVSCMELLQGARDKREMAAIRRFLLDFETMPLSEDIGYRGFLYMEQHALKVSLAPVDALIVATAVERQEILCTGNTKHYRPISELELKPFRP
jgi:predicted nucleic acid-binding protein